MEFSISSLAIQEPGSGSTASELRQPPKPTQASQALRPSQGSKSSSLDALGPARKEEEASFWKINAELSRGEGPESEFQSLTPSQIKSIEKGEKVLPPSYRHDPAPRDREAKVDRPGNPRQEQRAPPSTGAEPVQPWTSTEIDPAPSEPVPKPPSPEAKQEDVEDDALFSEPAPAQVGDLLDQGAPSRSEAGRRHLGCGYAVTPLPLLPQESLGVTRAELFTRLR